MATNWAKEQNDAYNTLAADGVMFAFTREVKGEFDPVAGEYLPGSSEDFTAPGIIDAYNSQATYQNIWKDKSAVQIGDKIILAAGLTYDPQIGDRVIVYGEQWAVQAFSSVEPGEVPILNYLLIRKA